MNLKPIGDAGGLLRYDGYHGPMETSPPEHGPLDAIELHGVRVHNLKSIDVRIPLHRLTVVTGVSGSGKSSLAFDTLYAEGQRRYIESFSPYARQFLERLDKPDADRIDNLPPAIALRQNSVAPGKRSTVATATELYDYLRLLFAKAGRILDPHTGREVRRESPGSVAKFIEGLPAGRRVLIAFPASDLFDADDVERPSAGDRLIDAILERGFSRAIFDGSLVHLARDARPAGFDRNALVVVDRVTTGQIAHGRLLESIETAFAAGEACIALTEGADVPGQPLEVDGSWWSRHDFHRRTLVDSAGRKYAEPSPALFSYHSPIGACPTCRGFGSVPVMSWEKLVPDPSKSLAEGAIVAWTTPAYKHELEELLDLADDYDIPTEVPFSQLRPEHLALIHDGVKKRRFGGLRGFFKWLERKRYKIGVAAFLARFRSYELCPDCGGTRLNRDALAVQVGGKNIAQICAQTVTECRAFFDTFVAASDPGGPVARAILPEIRSRLASLERLGLGYVCLDRPTVTLSGGEARRVALTAAIGANLVNMLYVLDEPSTGLHPRDRTRVIETLADLRDAPNTVVVVEHDLAFVDAADVVIDLGPGAGREGGQVLYAGAPAGLVELESSPTAVAYRHWLETGHEWKSEGARRDAAKPREAKDVLTLSPCDRHNLKHLTVTFPLQRLCVVSGVSGSGKSTLVTDTLYPAVCRALQKPCDLEDIDRKAVAVGADAFDDVVLIDQSPIGRTPRSNPATYLGVFDFIRQAFAALPEAKLRSFTAGTFSFNTDRGRCPHCSGAGVVSIEMQFLPDIEVTCPECHGKRFIKDVLDIKLRGQNIADVLAMTAAEAFAFFRGYPKIQRRLTTLKEVGLDYLPLGQTATTLSGGESQRLKIASFLGGGTGKRTLFLFDEPTTGLHAADVATFLTCVGRLIGVGHSVVIVEHRLDVIRAADWIIDLGPEAGDAGGSLVAEGPPSVIAGPPESITGRFLSAERRTPPSRRGITCGSWS
jgi:excinuclease ABC subunit A